MKFFIYALCFAALAVFGFGHAYASTEAEILSISYPHYEAKVPVTFFSDNAMVMFYGPEEAVTFNMVIQPEPDRNLEQYTAFSKEQIKNLPDFKVENEGFETYNGVKFATALNNFKRDAMNLKSKGVWTVFNKKAYVLTYTAPAASFEKYLKTADAAFASFKTSPLSITMPKDFVPQNSIMMGFGESTPEEFRINFNIIVKPEAEKTLEEFTEFSKKEASKIPGFTILKEGYETYGGVKYFSVIHKFKQGEVPLKARSVWTITNKKVYILTYTSTEGSFSKYEADIESLCKNFSVK
ncbi:MAG TPA: DcrB-related protein [Candidatus Wallbacteria bacterium]|nr:MAG: hypothetical protein BWY32_02324 [bacterium ADurb.Bin243]HPG57558.1 DcrB-related protein [Candidatus Wallbacteria bacterium]